VSWQRYAKKVDENQVEIVAALRKAGVLVAIIGRPVDLLTFHRGRFLPLEIKRAKARPRKDQEAQLQFIVATGCPVVKSAEEALCAVMGDVPCGTIP
jgi:hypothetical protein